MLLAEQEVFNREATVTAYFVETVAISRLIDLR